MRGKIQQLKEVAWVYVLHWRARGLGEGCARLALPILGCMPRICSSSVHVCHKPPEHYCVWSVMFLHYCPIPFGSCAHVCPTMIRTLVRILISLRYEPLQHENVNTFKSMVDAWRFMLPFMFVINYHLQHLFLFPLRSPARSPSSWSLR